MLNRTLTDSPNSNLLALAWLLLALGLSLLLVEAPITVFAIGTALLFILGAVFSRRFGEVIIVVMFYELILGGAGHIIDFGNAVSLRMLIFGLVLLCFMAGWVGSGRLKKDLSWKVLPASWLGTGAGIGTFLFFGIFLGTAYRNVPVYIFRDSYGYLFLVAAIPIYFLSSREGPGLKFVTGSFLSAVFVFGLLKAIAFLLVRLHILNLTSLVQTISDATSQTVAEAGAFGSVRIAMVGDLFLAFAMPTFLAMAMSSKTRRTRIAAYTATLIVGVGLLASGTRGLWLGALLGISIVALLFGAKIKLKLFLGTCLIVLGTIAYFPTIATATVKRFDLSFDFSEPSNQLRVDQFGPLMEKAERHILLGNGFGATVPGMVRSVTAPYAFELQSVALLMKTGIIGCSLWLAFFLWLMWDLWKTSKATKSTFERAMARGLIGGLACLLLALNTNPYFQAATGMGCMTFTVLTADLLRIAVKAEQGAKDAHRKDQAATTQPATVSAGRVHSRRLLERDM